MTTVLLLLACNAPIVGGNSEVLGELPVWTVDTGGPDSGVVDTGLPPDPVEDPPNDDDPVPPAVLLNELVAKNESTWPGDDATWPDWVELYNASDRSVDVADLALVDNSGLPWVGEDGSLAPGERLVVALDGSFAGGLHAPFSLDADGDERLTLSVEGRPSDRLAIGALRTDLAWARYPDGGAWGLTPAPTPEAENAETPWSGNFDRSELVYQIDEVIPLNLRLSTADEAALRASRLSWLTAELDVPEGDWGELNVRGKAYVGSARSYDQKMGWKFDLNDIHGREWRGLRALTLNNMVQDNTYIHEFAAYQLYRALDVPAPRVGYSWLTVNGADYGLFLLIEPVDATFLDRWFGDPSGNLYEGAYGVDLYTYEVASFDLEMGADIGHTDLDAVIAVLDAGATDANYEAVQALVDMPRFLTLMAVEALTYHWDGYSTANNYRLYADPRTGLFTMIPWGTDQTFLTAYFTPWTGQGRLFQWCLSIDRCEQDYDDILYDATLTMESLDLATQIEDLESWLYPYISADPRREFDLGTHAAYVAATAANMRSIPQSVRDQLAAR